MHFSFSIPFDSPDFIAHWSSKYNYDSEPKYERNIGRPLTTHSRQELFEWKNGSPIAPKKMLSVVRNYPLKFDGKIEDRYLNPGHGGGAIWNIFYAHCLLPEKWPIFDQHVCRAMWYLLEGKFREIPLPEKKSEIFRVYRENYLPFYVSFRPTSQRRLDKALWMFGKFLKTAKRYA